MKKLVLSPKLFLTLLVIFIPQETVLCNDKDPPWFKKKIKQLIK